MILTIGEILTDRFVTSGKDGDITAEFIGGAPLNAAFAAQRAGANVTFIGRVGEDKAGDFLQNKAKDLKLGGCVLQRDEKRATTVALVTLKNGERSFRFLRDETADIFVEEPEEQLFEEASILHLGTLMLSHPYGRAFADGIIQRAKNAGKTVAIDANFREDLFASASDMISAFGGVLCGADILKLSDDELFALMPTDFQANEVNSQTIDAALTALNVSAGLICVTAGAKGSFARFAGKLIEVASQPLESVVDTTGAGDAFFGTLIGNIDLVCGGDINRLSEEALTAAMRAANVAGAAATQYKGAISV